jgi:PAS domain S-box-containing protein
LREFQHLEAGLLVIVTRAFASGRIMADITDDRRAKTAAHESAARVRAQLAELQHLYEHAPVGLCMLDRGLRYVRVNERLAELNGLSVATHIGRTVHEIVPTLAAAVEEVTARILATGHPVVAHEFTGETAAQPGFTRHFSESWYPVRDDDGTIAGFGVVVEEITERKRAAEALRESEERFRMLADNMSQLAWIADERGSIFWFNQRWYDYTGTTLDEIQGWGWTKVLHPDHVDRVVARIQQSWTTGEPWGDTFPLRAKDGEYRWFLSHAVPIRNAQGQVIRWFGTNTDITEQRILEETLREADRRKNEFLATLGHELRNPLAPIRTAIGLLRTRVVGDPVIVRCRDVLDRQVTQMARLLDDLLDVARLSRGKLGLQRSRVLLDTVLDAAIETSLPLIEQRRQQLTVQRSEQPIALDADAARLTQVFGNLLNNAAKYSPEHAQIRLSVELHDETVVIRVRDTGHGIAPEMLSNVFELFTQATDGRVHAPGGLGIGLSLARELVELHGGTITAASPGLEQGAEFTVRLPARAERRTDEFASVNNAAHSPSQLGRRVLVADDNVDGAEMLTAMLVAMGCDVRTVHTGSAAIREAEAFRPDVALLDIGMPDVSGLDVSRHVRSKPWGTAMVLVAVTGWGQEEDRQRSLDAGFDRHLVKPVDSDVLVDLIREVQPRGSAPKGQSPRSG